METTTETYNGWKNYQTWNVALWIGNDEPLYRGAVEFMHNYTGKLNPYKAFIKRRGMAGEYTPDRVKWMSSKLDYPALEGFMRELIS